MLRRQADALGLAAAQEMAQEVDGVLAALPAGAPNRHQDGLGAGARPSAIAAPDFAQDDAEANRQFATPVGGVQAGELEERQEIVLVVPQVLGEGFIGGVRLGRIDGVEQFAVESATTDRQAMITQLPVGMPIAKIQGVMQQFADATRKTHGAARGRFQEFIATPEQMAKALLVRSV